MVDLDVDMPVSLPIMTEEAVEAVCFAVMVTGFGVPVGYYINPLTFEASA